MRTFLCLMAAVASASALTLNELCTVSYAQSSLPAAGFYNGITIDSSSVVTTIGTNYSIKGNTFFPDTAINYCNISFAYTHDGRNDVVHVAYWVPEPSNFQNRFLATGGGGLAINSGASTVSGGVSIGAVGGYMDGGFGNFNTNADAKFLLANGTVNWENAYMFGYQAIHEMTVLGKELTKNLFSMKNGTKLYSYYQGCSEGGRDGWSQVQRYYNELDGASLGAPAFRYSHQQIQHLYSNVVEHTLNYYPPPCEMMAIVNATIKACDPLDGKTDGVVARTDLCKLHFNVNSTIGLPYSCAASSGGGGFGPGSGRPTPAQNGVVSAKAVAVAQTILDGIHDLQGRQVYFSYQPSATFADAQTSYNNATGQWELSISNLGAEFVTRYLELIDSSTLPNLNGVTYDTLKGWIYDLWQTYEDSLQVNWPDLTRFEEAGGKVIHYHGESDDSIPAASSVRYWESVRSVMYPDLSYNESSSKIQDFYRLFLVPGGAHCGANQYQPNGAWPQTSMTQLIDWVENGKAPELLNATVSMGKNKGENQKICLWPLRPYYGGNGTELQCVYDQASIDTWHYDLNAWKMPVW
ncbi:tannase subunit [Zopfia rhizophila CBS 207.26]|uniref:Carboxylic ester hydrolase n=1 Tax=Zopfia rhizophila CBS 207.26 TaxID=1314779 RepID=A0A6A6EQ88_9PEZI|nr:tannase subunit [Zopfia rhizophila CBS 207.26]